jgi:hypothetical protein
MTLTPDADGRIRNNQPVTISRIYAGLGVAVAASAAINLL